MDFGGRKGWLSIDSNDRLPLLHNLVEWPSHAAEDAFADGYIFRGIKNSPALSPVVTMIMRKGKRIAPLNRLYFIKLSMNIRSKSYARETDPKDKEVRHEQM